MLPISRPEKPPARAYTFSASRAEMMRSCITTSTPLPREPWAAATRTAESKLIGPSGLMPVAGNSAARGDNEQSWQFRRCLGAGTIWDGTQNNADTHEQHGNAESFQHPWQQAVKL